MKTFRLPWLCSVVSILSVSSLNGFSYVYQLNDEFEQSALARPPWTVERGDFELGNVTIQPDIVRTGSKAVRLVNKDSDAGVARERTEMVAGSSGTLNWDQELDLPVGP